MRLHEIPGDPGLKRGPKRVGRGHGSGSGKTAGRGHKGRQARSGGRKRKSYFEGGQMPLSRRVPKRGFTNRAFRREVAVVNLENLNRFDDGATVDFEALRSRRLVRRAVPVKILAKGSLEKRNLTVHAHAFSGAARQAIEAAGGTCVVIEAA
jgi:large subunit ribosomal protein L15